MPNLFKVMRRSGGNLAEVWCSFNFISSGLKGFLLQDADLCEDPDGQDDYS